MLGNKLGEITVFDILETNSMFFVKTILCSYWENVFQVLRSFEKKKIAQWLSYDPRNV